MRALKTSLLTLLATASLALGALVLSGCGSSEPPAAKGPEAQVDQSASRPAPGVQRGQTPTSAPVEMGGRPGAGN